MSLPVIYGLFPADCLPGIEPLLVTREVSLLRKLADLLPFECEVCPLIQHTTWEKTGSSVYRSSAQVKQELVPTA